MLEFRVLGHDDVALMREMLRVFGEAFHEEDTYLGAPAPTAYLQNLLNTGTFVAIAAVMDGAVVGGIAGYLLHKFEQERAEFYLYDLAVAEPYRRQGIASGMIRRLKEAAKERGAYIVFVQADTPDAPAIALYEKFGKCERVLQFDIDI